MNEQPPLKGISPLAAPQTRLKPQAKEQDRLSMPAWQDWIVDLLIRKHDEGCSDNQLRMMLAVEFDRRMRIAKE